VRRRLGPASQLDAWPGVSIIVPSRNGREHLGRLVDGLRDATDYPEFELIAVDNGSDDETIGWLGTVTDISVRHVANAENVSYSHANTQVAELGAHPTLLFLNNDVQQFERGWLRELVASHVLGAHTITGATLLHTERTRRSADGRLVQHRAIRLYRTPAGIAPSLPALPSRGPIRSAPWTACSPATTGARIARSRPGSRRRAGRRS